MDISIVNVALPAIRHDLHASESDLQWTVDAYTLVLASFLVLAGSTADRVGRRRVFQVGLAAFGLGSLLCGAGAGHRRPDRGARAAGRRGHDAQPGGDGDRGQHVPRPGRAGQGHRRVRLDVRPGAGAGPDPGRRAGRQPRLALHLLDQRADRGRRDRGRRAVRARVPRRPGAPVRPGGPGPDGPGAGQRRLRDHRVRAAGLDLAGHPRPARRRRARRAGHPRLRAAPGRPAAGAAPVPQRAVQRGDPDGAVGLVRVRRVPVRDHPVPAGRARPVGADGRAVPDPGRAC